jgi:hypothetical protein
MLHKRWRPVASMKVRMNSSHDPRGQELTFDVTGLPSDSI